MNKQTPKSLYKAENDYFKHCYVKGGWPMVRRAMRSFKEKLDYFRLTCERTEEALRELEKPDAEVSSEMKNAYVLNWIEHYE